MPRSIVNVLSAVAGSLADSTPRAAMNAAAAADVACQRRRARAGASCASIAATSFAWHRSAAPKRKRSGLARRSRFSTGPMRSHSPSMIGISAGSRRPRTRRNAAPGWRLTAASTLGRLLPHWRRNAASCRRIAASCCRQRMAAACSAAKPSIARRIAVSSSKLRQRQHRHAHRTVGQRPRAPHRRPVATPPRAPASSTRRAARASVRSDNLSPGDSAPEISHSRSPAWTCRPSVCAPRLRHRSRHHPARAGIANRRSGQIRPSGSR